MEVVENKFSPGILSLLPLFYIGWSDSVLSPSEIKVIHKRLKDFKHLSKSDTDYLIKWTDPKNPPNEEIFKEWVRTIQYFSKDLKIEEKNSLASIGLNMAKVSLPDSENYLAAQPKVKDALEEIAIAMGLDNQASLDLLIGRIEQKPTTESSASFSIEVLRDALDGANKETKDRMRKLLQDPFFSYQTIRDKEQYRLQVLSWTKALAEQGLGAYAFPKKYGGGEKIGDHISVFEMLAYHDLSLTIKFGVQFGLFGGAVYGLGSERHHRKYVDALGKAELLGCFAMTETGHGSNVRGLETTATYDNSNGTITIHSPSRSSGKEYIGNAMHSSMAAVFAQLIVDGENHGVHAILVPIRDKDNNLLPGVEIQDNGYKMGLNGVDNGRIWFNQVKVPKENLLNKYGDIDDDGKYFSPIKNPSKRFFTMLGALVVGRVCVGLAGVNVSKSALAIAIKYASRRRQFEGRDEGTEMLIMDYPTHQKRLYPLMAKSYAYYISLSKLAEDFIHATPEETRKIETKAAGLKAIATWHNTRTVQECREACGGKGYLTENRFADLKADSDIFTTFEGDNTVLLQLVAKGLLTEFKQSFHDEGFRAVLRYLGSRFSQKVAEYNPYYSRMTDAAHLKSRSFHLHALRYREKKLLMTLSNRMRDYLKKKIHPYDAFLKCQVHMVELGQAYIERLALKDFVKFIENADPQIQPVLNKVCDLYALSIIDENKGWFLETGYLEGSKTKAMRRVITKLCKELRPEATSLVDAWGIPDSLLGAEILK